MPKKDKDSLVLNFADIKDNKNISKAISMKKNEKSKSNKSNPKIATNREEAKAKLDRARTNGLKEIEEFIKASEEYLKKIEDSCLFHSVHSIISNEFIDVVANNLLEPIIRGIRPNGMPPELFKIVRSEMYKSLIYHYEGEE